jgi:hypothetical protein
MLGDDPRRPSLARVQDRHEALSLAPPGGAV